MLRFLRAGGVGMWVVILFAVLTLIAAIVFAVRADARKLAVIRALTWATVFAVLASMSAGFVAVMWKVPAREEWAHSPDLHLIIMQGLGELMTPAVLGFTVLAIAWLLVAVGTRRLQNRE